MFLTWNLLRNLWWLRGWLALRNNLAMTYVTALIAKIDSQRKYLNFLVSKFFNSKEKNCVSFPLQSQSEEVTCTYWIFRDC